MPASAKAASVSSASPPSAGIGFSTCPWSAKASRVASGMVSIVNGAASAVTYSTSGASGFLVEVLAHSRRWGRAPSFARRPQPAESSTFR